MSAVLRIERERSARRDRFRSYKVLLDQEVIGELKYGEVRDFSVMPGDHEIRLKIDWTGSETLQFSVVPGETVRFQCRPGGSAWTALWVSVFKPETYLVLEQHLDG